MPYFDIDNHADAEATAEDYLAVAADVVQQLAPAPDPEPASYAERAARAERLVYNWLVSTKGGALSAKGGIPGATGSKTFASLPVVRNLVAGAMGAYARTGEEAAGGADDGRGHVGRARF